jgi:hypothetical protein
MNNCLAEVKRLVYEGTVANKKEIINSYQWYLTAINEESKLSWEWKFGKLYKLSITSIVDIRESDEILVDWKSYTVKWVAQRKGWWLRLTTVILEKGN